jgi:hypothetical protein
MLFLHNVNYKNKQNKKNYMSNRRSPRLSDKKNIIRIKRIGDGVFRDISLPTSGVLEITDRRLQLQVNITEVHTDVQTQQPQLMCKLSNGTPYFFDFSDPTKYKFDFIITGQIATTSHEKKNIQISKKTTLHSVAYSADSTTTQFKYFIYEPKIQRGMWVDLADLKTTQCLQLLNKTRPHSEIGTVIDDHDFMTSFRWHEIKPWVNIAPPYEPGYLIIPWARFVMLQEPTYKAHEHQEAVKIECNKWYIDATIDAIGGDRRTTRAIVLDASSMRTSRMLHEREEGKMSVKVPNYMSAHMCTITAKAYNHNTFVSDESLRNLINRVTNDRNEFIHTMWYDSTSKLNSIMRLYRGDDHNPSLLSILENDYLWKWNDRKHMILAATYTWKREPMDAQRTTRITEWTKFIHSASENNIRIEFLTPPDKLFPDMVRIENVDVHFAKYKALMEMVVIKLSKNDDDNSRETSPLDPIDTFVRQRSNRL